MIHLYILQCNQLILLSLITELRSKKKKILYIILSVQITFYDKYQKKE